MSKETEPSPFLPRGSAEALGRASLAQSVANALGGPVKVTPPSRQGRPGRFELAVDSTWTAAGKWRSVDDRAVIEELSFQLAEGKKLPPGGLSKQALRLDPGSLGARIMAQLVADRESSGVLRKPTKRVRAIEGALAKRPRGRPDRGDAFYHRVAEVFLEEQRSGTKNIHEAVAKRMAPEMNLDYPAQPETVRSWIKKAQERSFITAGTPGKAQRVQGPNFTTFANQGES